MSVAWRPVRTPVHSGTAAGRRSGTRSTLVLSPLFLAAAVAVGCGGSSVLSPDPAACTFEISPSARQVSTPSNAAGTIRVETTSTCTWTATTDVRWIHLTRSTGGRGNGWVSVEVDGNFGLGGTKERTGSVIIAGQRSTVTQVGDPPPAGCSYTIDPGSQTLGAMFGATAHVGVATDRFCHWTATSDAPWITVTTGSGVGSGVVGFSLAPNTGAARTGTLTIAGRTATIGQTAAGAAAPRPPAPSACTYTISPIFNGGEAAAPERSGIDVLTSNTCAWTATSNDAWITIVSGARGTGNGVVNYSIPSNGTGSSRTGRITIAGLTFVYAQGGITGPRQQSPCTYTLSQNSQTVKSFGGKSTISLTASSFCGWVAVSNDSWITILAGEGTGNGTVTFFVTPNFGPDRRGTLTVGGRRATIEQSGWP